VIAYEKQKKGQTKMNIKNYTSSVSIINSINRIEFRLSQAGATHIAKTYEKERPTGMIFQIPVNGFPLTFKVPSKVDKVYEYMLKQRKSPPTQSAKETVRQQADRTAWKILADWVDIQVSLIEINHVETIEAFLQYTYDGREDKTLFEKMKQENFKLLNQA
jgi:hypothetical protein